MAEFTTNLPQNYTHVRFMRMVWHEKDRRRIASQMADMYKQ